VHGNGNKPARDPLKRTWDLALFGAAAGTRSRMAYWADLRYPAPLPDPDADGLESILLEEGLADDEVRPAELIHEAMVEAHAETLVETPASGGGLPGGGTALGGSLDSWLQEMAYIADAVVQGEAAPFSDEEALPLPRAARVAIFRALVKRTFADVYAYFFGGAGDAMRDRLRTTLAEVDGPVVVIAHSLGSIIAYDVLREAGPARDIPLLVTVGSPLGVTEIQDLVATPLRVPDDVAAWRNVADGRDLVALDRTIRPEYAPAERTTDFLVVNDSGNHHGIREYLSTAPVRTAVNALVS
jgi:alpha-beta hydrolase superfamily lysophospholipase